jgi:hypothetical protein
VAVLQLSDREEMEVCLVTSERTLEIERAMKLEGGLVLRTMLLMFVAVAAYLVAFGIYLRLPLGGPDSWAQFGDYFGGVMNPVLGLVTLIFVVRTLRTTRQEAAETRAHLEVQTEQMRLQVRRIERQEALAEIQKRLDGTLAAWQEALQQPAEGLVRLHRNGGDVSYVPSNWDMRTALHLPALPGELSTLKNGPWSQGVLDKWVPALEPLVLMLDEFKRYCAEYDHLAGNRDLTDYYRHRIQSPLRVVLALGLGSEGEFDSLLVSLRFREFLSS